MTIPTFGTEGEETASPRQAEPVPFWRKPLEALSPSEWEQLCDGCGRCCLVKLEDEDTAETYYTDVACRLLDTGTCRCSDYPGRQAKVPDCVRLTPEAVRSIPWLPPTCAYRLRRENRDLAWWHPLVSGRPETVVEAGVSVRGRVSLSEDDLPPENLPGRIVSWPDRVPKRARGAQPPHRDVGGSSPQTARPRASGRR